MCPPKIPPTNNFDRFLCVPNVHPPTQRMKKIFMKIGHRPQLTSRHVSLDIDTTHPDERALTNTIHIMHTKSRKRTLPCMSMVVEERGLQQEIKNENKITKVFSTTSRSILIRKVIMITTNQYTNQKSSLLPYSLKAWFKNVPVQNIWAAHLYMLSDSVQFNYFIFHTSFKCCIKIWI